ncbi:hypothetical protein AB0J42_36840 [Nonomuraea sp. NPDC049649]|uniref:hypothetical protein n=1 Tax=Nonomuraea sp. NPDC049649 TaxID=3155776 RepID=UPI00341756DC
MPSIDYLLDRHEVEVRARVQGLREEAERINAALVEAERDLDHVEITRATLAAVVGRQPAPAHAETPEPVAEPAATVPATVPTWQEGQSVADLPAHYRPLWRAISRYDRPVRAGQLRDDLGLEPVAAKTEGVRAKLKKLAARGWIERGDRGAFWVPADRRC